MLIHLILIRLLPVQGEKGNKGDEGKQGAQGPRGEEGKQGQPGRQGLQGLQGPRGEEGQQGRPGRIDEDRLIQIIDQKVREIFREQEAQRKKNETTAEATEIQKKDLEKRKKKISWKPF